MRSGLLKVFQLDLDEFPRIADHHCRRGKPVASRHKYVSGNVRRMHIVRRLRKALHHAYSRASLRRASVWCAKVNIGGFSITADA